MIPSRTRRVYAPPDRHCAMCGGRLRAGAVVVMLESRGPWGLVEHCLAHVQPCPTSATLRVVGRYRTAA
jgi:hypothetical protein